MLTAAFNDAPEELDVTITEPSGRQASAVERAAAALTEEVIYLVLRHSCGISCIASRLPAIWVCLQNTTSNTAHDGLQKQPVRT